MKKVFLVGLVALVSLGSCKQEYTCNCVYTETEDGELDESAIQNPF